jgi:NitT/TauT family transport system ATP-binding protein
VRAVVELDGVRAGRGGAVVLDGISLRIEPGERVALLGANGVGKSTLLDVVLGLERAAQGTVSVLGAAPPARDVGFLAQDPDTSLLPWLSVQDNIELPLRVRGLPARERAGAFEAVRARLDPAGAIDPRAAPRRLSGGERQRVAMMRAWVGAPRLVVADEPLSAIDLPGRLALREAMRRASEGDGTALLFVTHDLADVLALADRALVLAGRPARVRAALAVGGLDLASLEDALRGAVADPSPAAAPREASSALAEVST